MTFNEENGLPNGVLGEEGRNDAVGVRDGGARRQARPFAEWRAGGPLRVWLESDEGRASASAAGFREERPRVRSRRQAAVKPGHLASLLWFLGIVLVTFGIVETWLGNGIGEMTNFILAGFALRFFARDLAE